MDIKGGNKWQECGMGEDSATINNNRGYPGCGCLSPWYPSQAAPAHRRLPGIGFLQGTRSTVYRVRFEHVQSWIHCTNFIQQTSPKKQLLSNYIPAHLYRKNKN